MRRLQDAHTQGNQDTASAMLNDLFTRYGHATVADVMHQRHQDDQLTTELTFRVKSTC
ncbi:hypothetical protein ACQP2U_43490 (plasmid) [Nocardia sp. CA-084685]|uniref:hypothetical protein n=1 Tax=Nocardia sp. CA-084685 TaxID=3239970 RepID=UPI003D98B08B